MKIKYLAFIMEKTSEKILSKCTTKNLLHGKNQIGISNRHIRKKIKIIQNCQGDRRKFLLVKKNLVFQKDENNKIVWNCLYCNKGKKGQGWIK